MQKKKRSKLKIVTPIVILIVLIGLGLTAYILFPRRATQKVATSSFIFNATKAPGWFAGDSIEPTVNPTVSLNVAQGTKENPSGNCFAMFSYYANDSTTPATLLSQTIKSDSISFEPTSTRSYTMAASGGDLSYQLHQYNLVGDPGNQMERGNEFAFFRSGAGYIAIRGYCATAADLAQMAPVFSAVSFKQ